MYCYQFDRNKFIGSTTLLTKAYTPDERAKTQATHDFLMFSFVALTTFLSGSLLNRGGWVVVNLMGGEHVDVEIVSFPRQGKQMLRRGEDIEIYDVSNAKSFGSLEAAD